MRRAIVYVLQNFKHHVPAETEEIDVLSSARWFTGWENPLPKDPKPPPVRAPMTWMARKGWHRADGKIRFAEGPAGWTDAQVALSTEVPA